MAKADLLIFS